MGEDFTNVKSIGANVESKDANVKSMKDSEANGRWVGWIGEVAKVNSMVQH